MTDLEMTQLCAKAVGFELHDDSCGSRWRTVGRWLESEWNPLHNDVQMVALVKKFGLCVREISQTLWAASKHFNLQCDWVYAPTLNRAVVACVAKMELEKRK